MTAWARRSTLIRHGRFKYVYYVACPLQPFDLAAADPEELCDLSSEPGFAITLNESQRRLRALLDAEEIDCGAKRRQAELLARNGRNPVIARGARGYSPPPRGGVRV
jgi:hypothetical protein